MLNCSAYVAWINAEDGQGYVVSYWIDGACFVPEGTLVCRSGLLLADVDMAAVALPTRS